MSPSASVSTVVERRRLRAELRSARRDAGLTQEYVASAMDWSLSKIIRIETGSVGISTNDLTALLRLYEVTDNRRVRQLVELARAARKPSWWSRYRGAIPSTFFQYLEYEAAASGVLTYETFRVPGLLQTEQYATTTISEYRGDLTPKAIRIRVEVRMERQKLLEQPDPPRLHFLLDEGVIQRLLGDERVRAGQLRKLIEMAARPTVTIEILPFSAGLHSGMGENFTILEFRDAGDDDVLYFESARDSLFQNEAEQVSLYREMFGDLRKISLGVKKSMAYLTRIEAEAATP